MLLLLSFPCSYLAGAASYLPCLLCRSYFPTCTSVAVGLELCRDRGWRPCQLEPRAGSGRGVVVPQQYIAGSPPSSLVTAACVHQQQPVPHCIAVHPQQLVRHRAASCSPAAGVTDGGGVCRAPKTLHHEVSEYYVASSTTLHHTGSGALDPTPSRTSAWRPREVAILAPPRAPCRRRPGRSRRRRSEQERPRHLKDRRDRYALDKTDPKCPRSPWKWCRTKDSSGGGELDGESKSDEDETRGRMMTHGGLS